MRLNSIWVPLLIGGSAAVTFAVLAHRQSRLAVRQGEREERPLSPSATGSERERSLAERLSAGAPGPKALASDFDLDTAEADAGRSTPGNAERGEAYDALNADDLGAEWLTRATESLPVTPTGGTAEELDRLTTVEVFEDEPASLPTIELEPDSKPPSEEMLGDANPEDLVARLQRPRQPGVSDIAELTQEEDAPRERGRGRGRGS